MEYFFNYIVLTWRKFKEKVNKREAEECLVLFLPFSAYPVRIERLKHMKYKKPNTMTTIFRNI